MEYFIYAVAFVAVLIAVSMVVEYWQSRSRGLSHCASLSDSAVAGTFLSCLAICDLVVAAAVH